MDKIDVNCGICKDIVEEDSEGLICDVCNGWFHNNCNKTPLSFELYALLNEAPDNVKWFCDKCIWDTETWMKGRNNKSFHTQEKVTISNETIHNSNGESDIVKHEVTNVTEKVNEGINYEHFEGIHVDDYEEFQEEYNEAHSPAVSEYTPEDMDGADESEKKDKLHKCSMCDKSFNLRKNLAKHRRIHTGKNLHQCSICNKTFTKKSNMEKHIRIHIGDKPYQCNLCDKKMATKGGLKYHELTHTREKPYQCSNCGDSFARKGPLKQHMMKQHKKIRGQKCHVCIHCGKSFTRNFQLVDHERMHTGEKPYQCSHCGRCFSRKDKLKLHERIHTGNKPHQCNICGNGFTRSDYLVKHMRIHTGEKPYQCSDCGKLFSCKSNLNSHTKECPNRMNLI